ncbi:hypothetical protein BJF84_21355 [Rhodococcus sp. CUA-806]|nr:hypothetical protein BJF84_21355 [Rhodococcus sp. CUA-806]
MFLASNRLVLGYDSGGWFQPNPDGGVAYEHQPLTPNWAVEFFCSIEIPTRDNGSVNVFLDRNWTAGGSASSTEYQVYFSLYKTTTEDDEGNETVERRAYIRCRHKGDWFPALTFGFSLTQAQWAANNQWKIIVFQDKYIGIVMNGKLFALRILENANYYLGGGKRAANFRNNHQSEVYIEDFRTYDRPALPTSWVSEFLDEFTGANTSNGPGNGWSALGDNHGILSNAYSMRQPFPPPSDGRRGIWRGGLTRGDMRVAVVFGGGTGDPNGTAETCVVGRVNETGTLGIAAHFWSTRVKISVVSGPFNSPTYTDLTDEITVYGGNIAFGETYALNILGDEAWIDRASDGALLCWTDGINAASPETNRGHGLIVRRQTFINSAPVTAVRASVAA